MKIKPLNKKIPYVYIYLYSKLKKKYPHYPYLKPKQILEVLKLTLRVPKTLYYPTLFQMEECKLLKRINHQKYKLLKSKCERTLERLRCKSLWD